MFVVVERDYDSVTAVFGDRDNPWIDKATAQAFADAKQDVQDNDDGDLTYYVMEVTKPDIP